MLSASCPPAFGTRAKPARSVGTEYVGCGLDFMVTPLPPPMRGTRFPFEAIARLQPGLSPEVAQGRLDALVASLRKQYPGDYPAQAAWTLHLTTHG